MRAFLETVRQRRALSAGVGGAVILVSAVLVLVGLSMADDPEAAQPDATLTATATATRTPTRTPVASPTPVRFGSILNGAPMTEEEWNARKDLLPIAVMLDNTPNSIPHSGIGNADVVYEAFVEGGITRLMAVFWSKEAEKLEPIRSARTPFVIWVDELGALYGHAGAADTDNEADAVGQIFEWGILDLNAFTPGPSSAYYRDSERFAPYNLATSTTALREAAGRLNFAGPPRTEPWKFKADGDGTSSAPAAGGIQVNFQPRGAAWQTIQWRWDDASQSYLRFQFGGPFIDGETKEQVKAKNVVVMRVPWRVVDASAHVLLEQFGTGEATVYLDGKAIAGTWKKDDRKGRTRFYDASGAEIAFNRGPIWVEVVGPDSPVTTTPTAAELPDLPAYVPPPPSAIPEEPEELPSPATPDPTEPGTSTPATTTPTTGASETPTVGETITPEPQTLTPAPSVSPIPSPES
jgi:hypothetical protein